MTMIVDYRAMLDEWKIFNEFRPGSRVVFEPMAMYNRGPPPFSGAHYDHFDSLMWRGEIIRFSSEYIAIVLWDKQYVNDAGERCHSENAVPESDISELVRVEWQDGWFGINQKL